MTKVFGWCARCAEMIAATLLAAIFVTFILGIVFRYAPFLEPIGWSVVLISLLWVWLIFFGCAFIVRDRDHVTFDVLYVAAPRPVRKVFAVLTAVLMIAVVLWSLPAIWDSVFANRLMDLKKIQTLRVPVTGGKIAIKWLFAPFVMLMCVVVLRYSWRLYTTLRFGPPGTETDDLTTSATMPGDRDEH